MGLYPVAVCYNARQDGTVQYSKIQYSTIQYNTITHLKHNNTQHSSQTSILKITKRNQEPILYTIKTQKRVEPKVDESVLKATRYTKQPTNHTIQHSVTPFSPNLHPTAPHYRYIHFTSYH